MEMHTQTGTCISGGKRSRTTLGIGNPFWFSQPPMQLTTIGAKIHAPVDQW